MSDQKRMSDAARRELVAAIEADRIDNATQYAEEFAARHKLNPVTVRSTISRLRRELGLLKRRPRRPLPEGKAHPGWGKPSVAIRPADTGLSAIGLLGLDDATEPGVARLGAAALLRYERDEDFRKAVDRHRSEVERLDGRIQELREIAGGLTDDETLDLLRLLDEGSFAPRPFPLRGRRG